MLLSDLAALITYFALGLVIACHALLCSSFCYYFLKRCFMEKYFKTIELINIYNYAIALILNFLNS